MFGWSPFLCLLALALACPGWAKVEDMPSICAWRYYRKLVPAGSEWPLTARFAEALPGSFGFGETALATEVARLHDALAVEMMVLKHGMYSEGAPLQSINPMELFVNVIELRSSVANHLRQLAAAATSPLLRVELARGIVNASSGNLTTGADDMARDIDVVFENGAAWGEVKNLPVDRLETYQALSTQVQSLRTVSHRYDLPPIVFHVFLPRGIAANYRARLEAKGIIMHGPDISPKESRRRGP